MLPFKLSCQLQDHKGDVRAVCCLPGVDGRPDRIVTTSRDCTAKLWSVENESSGSFQLERTFRGHSKYVTAVCAMPATDSNPQGLIATGCQDHKIRIFDPSNEEAVQILSGHTGNVCTLMCGKFGTLLSGSWDSTARVWSSFQCVLELKGHTAAVWAVALVPGSGKHLTASADSSIKIWYLGKCERTLTQHTDCVRALTVVNNNEFLSASNDGSCRRWLMSGDCVQVYQGHTAFVYSLASLSFGFASSGEDKSVRVWQDGEEPQVIRFPTESVWAVCALTNGDIVAGSSDSMARVFTQCAERMASAEELQAYDDQIQLVEDAAKSNQSQLGDLQLKNVQGPSCLGTPGRSEGETRLVREDGGVYAYQWDTTSQQWAKIGLVENAIDRKTRGQALDGKEYDYVFSIDVEDGKPALKLGYNRGEDPWLVARKFLEHNMLPMEYLEQVAEFIVTNAGGAAAMPQGGGGQQFADPFTGAGRYVPGSGAGNGTAAAGGADPFTGAGRYVPGSAGGAAGSGGGFSSGGSADPFTGGGRYVPGTAGTPSSATSASTDGASQRSTSAAATPSMGSLTVSSNEYFPKTSAVLFESANVAGMLKKLTEFNATVPEELRLSDSRMATLTDLVTKLAAGSCSPLSSEELSCLRSLREWPKSHLLPGLDAVRLAMRHCPADLCRDDGPALLDFLFEACLDVKSSVCLVALRTLCNMCGDKTSAQHVLDKMELVSITGQQVAVEAGGAHQVAACTLLLNCAVLLRPVDSLEQSASLMSNIQPVFMTSPLSDDAAFRLLVAIGTLVCGVPEAEAVADSLRIQLNVASFTTSSTTKVKDCASLLLGQLPR